VWEQQHDHVALDDNHSLTAPQLLQKTSRPTTRPKSPYLKIIPAASDASPYGRPLHPTAVLDHAASSATNLLAIVSDLNDLLHSPVLSSFHRSVGPSPVDKPLPLRPRSFTAPPTPSIAELPGSILLENEGFPLTVEPFELDGNFDDMRRTRFGFSAGFATDRNAPEANLIERPQTAPREILAHGPHHKKSLSENMAKANRQPMNPPALSTDSKLSTCSQTTNPMSSSFESVKAKMDSDSGRSLQPSPLIIEKKAMKRPSYPIQRSSNSTTSESEVSVLA
jgi:hypothetical protein